MKDDKDIETARKVSIAEMLGLRATNRRVHTRCPFHKDSTPSFVIYPDNSYHCYGCTAHGNNAIDFAMALTPELPPKEAFKQAVSELMAYRYPLS